MFRRRGAPEARAFEDRARRATVVAGRGRGTTAARGGRDGSTVASAAREGVERGRRLGGVGVRRRREPAVPAVSVRVSMVFRGPGFGRAGRRSAVAGAARRVFLQFRTTDPSVERPWTRAPGGAAAPGPAPDAPARRGDRAPPVPYCSAVKAIEDARLEFHTKDGDADLIDGHAVQNRVRVGLGIGMLDGRMEVNEQDWELAGLFMAVSDATRAAALKAEPRSMSQAQQAVAVNAAVEDDKADPGGRAVFGSVAPPPRGGVAPTGSRGTGAELRRGTVSRRAVPERLRGGTFPSGGRPPNGAGEPGRKGGAAGSPRQ